MKKLLTLIIGIALMCNANAETYLRVKTSVLESVVEQYFPDTETQIEVVQKYNELLSDNNNQGLIADDLWKVCRAGGLKIRRDADKQTCENFVNALAAESSVFYNVCGTDKDKSDIIARCIEDVFDAKNGDGDVQVETRTAINLSQAYAKKQFNDKIECTDVVRTDSNDDFIACKSTITPKLYYEFRFSDAKEHKDNAILHGVEAGICAIYGLKYTKAGSATTGSVSAGAVSNVVSWPSACAASDAATCAQIEKTAADFNYTMKWTDKNGCAFESNIIRDANDIKNEYGNPPIDNWIFSQGIKNIELYATSELDKTIENYVKAKIAPTPLTSFDCKKTSIQYIRDIGQRDDILTCFVNGKQVDFVFDDLSQFRGFLGKKKIAASEQAIECMTADGVYDGKNCATVGQAACEQIKAASAEDCPDCKSVYWDDDAKICVLGAAKNATNWNKGIKIGTVAGTAVIAVLATVAVPAAAPGAWAIVAKVGSGLVMMGAAGQVTAEAKITYGVFEPFVEEANQCIQNKDAKCAEDLVINELNRMQSYSKELTAAEATALDEIFVRLVKLIPEDSAFWDDFFGNPDFWDCPVPGQMDTCVVKESAQIWQVVRTTSNVMMIAGGLMNILANSVSYFSETRNAILARITNHPRAIHKVSPVVRLQPNGTLGRLASIQELGGLRHADFIARNGLRMGQTFWLTSSGQVITNAARIGTLVGLIPLTVGAGNMIYHATNQDTDFAISRSEISNTNKTNTTNPTPVPDEETNPQEPVINPGPGADNSTVPGVTQQPVVTPDVTGSDITPYAVSDPRKTGLIVTAAVLGAVGTGLLIGGLISASQEDDNKPVSGNVSALEQDLNKLLENADNSLGFIDGNMIRLVRLATATGAYAPILNINGKAVVVVNYRGYNLPFYVDSGGWVPLLGIGAIGGWFNVYPTSGKTDIAYIDGIVDILNQQLNPGVTSQFVKANHLGLMFPQPGPDAYKIINSEFTNGVIQTYNGTFSPSEQTLYNNNYNKMKNLF